MRGTEVLPGLQLLPPLINISTISSPMSGLPPDHGAPFAPSTYVSIGSRVLPTVTKAPADGGKGWHHSVYPTHLLIARYTVWCSTAILCPAPANAKAPEVWGCRVGKRASFLL